MPHVIVKLWPRKSEQKIRLAEEIAKDVMRLLDYGESVSVAIEEVKTQGLG